MADIRDCLSEVQINSCCRFDWGWSSICDVGSKVDYYLLCSAQRRDPTAWGIFRRTNMRFTDSSTYWKLIGEPQSNSLSRYLERRGGFVFKADNYKGSYARMDLLQSFPSLIHSAIHIQGIKRTPVPSGLETGEETELSN